MQYGICSIGQKMKTYYTCALSYQALEPGLATYPVNALLCLRQRKAHYSVFYFLFFLFGALNEDFLFLAHASLCTPLALPVNAEPFQIVHGLH